MSHLGFQARETAPRTFKFQSVIYTASRNGEAMTKTLDPRGMLLTREETAQLGYDTDRLIEQARKQRVGLPCFEWRHHALAWEDLW